MSAYQPPKSPSDPDSPLPPYEEQQYPLLAFHPPALADLEAQTRQQQPPASAQEGGEAAGEGTVKPRHPAVAALLTLLTILVFVVLGILFLTVLVALLKSIGWFWQKIGLVSS
ncbi:hypothetical protein F4818DRAFT_444029 [Hypoxylon cercidicola]|nr:hypothetical protein F4818DRAFT_444029 [Hypoxylon cercidicola]